MLTTPEQRGPTKLKSQTPTNKTANSPSTKIPDVYGVHKLNNALHSNYTLRPEKLQTPTNKNHQQKCRYKTISRGGLSNFRYNLLN